MVIPVLHEERYPLAEQGFTARLALERLASVCNITYEFAICEGPAGRIVYNCGGLRVMGGEGFEDGKAGEGRGHAEVLVLELDAEEEGCLSGE